MLNEYNSKRLQIRLQESKNEKNIDTSLKHVSMIYTRLIDVNIFLQILIESNLVKQADNASNIQFNLPEILKKFYFSKI